MLEAEIIGSQWFVARLKPRGLAQARAHLQRQGFEHFSPEMIASELRHGKRREVLKPIFPGYLFVRFDPTDYRWTAINNTRGVAHLIGNSQNRPSSIPDALVAELRARYDRHGRFHPAEEFVIGDKVRVILGPFADMVTQIEALTDKKRVEVLLELMGRQVRTTLPYTAIIKAS